MSLDQIVTAVAAALIAFALTRLLVGLRLEAPPEALMRVNYAGRPVPAVLGGPVTLSALSAMTFLAAVAVSGWDAARTDGIGFAVVTVLVAMHLAGRWDDRRGDERPRGFSGHLGAARSGRLTGGLVKLATGVAAGLLAGSMVETGWGIVAVGAIVALTANLVNLLDRAPGRATKVALVGVAALVVFGPGDWVVAASGLVGAAVATLSFDLAEKAMLGDAGANPIGAVIGVGIATALTTTGRLVGIGVLLALNIASEFWSFSSAIDKTPGLRHFDRLGRRRT